MCTDVGLVSTTSSSKLFNVPAPVKEELCVQADAAAQQSRGFFRCQQPVCLCSSGPHIYLYTVQTMPWVFSCLLKRSRGLHKVKIPVSRAVHIRTFLKTLNIQKEEWEPCIHCPTASWLLVWYRDGTWPWGSYSGKAQFAPTQISTLSASLWAGAFPEGIFKEIPHTSTGC